MHHLPHLSPKKLFYSGIQPKLIALSQSSHNQKIIGFRNQRLTTHQSCPPAYYVDIS